MPRRNTAERDAEYERFKRFAIALAEFLDADAIADPQPAWSGTPGPDGEIVWTEHRDAPLPTAEGLREGIDALEQNRPRGWRAGLRDAVQDLLEMSRDLSPHKVQMADSQLKAQGVPTLTVMRSEIWRTVPKIIERGHIKTESEYYLLVEQLNNATDSALPAADRSRLAQIVAEFEERRIKRP